MSQTSDTPEVPRGFNPLAGIAAAILPGAGHLVLGERKRAVLIAAGILGLFFGGILIGGIDVIDSREDRVWFFGQALVGPLAFGVDYLHQHEFKGIPASNLERTPDRAWHLEDARLEGVREAARSAYPDEARVMTPVSVDTMTADRKIASSRMMDMPLLLTPKDGKPEGAGPPNIKSLSKVNELGTLFATIAGMLNVIVIVDALMPGRKKA